MTPSWRRCAGAMPASTEALLGRLLQAVEDELEAAVELRHRLHAAPELAHAEERTAAAVAEQMPVQCTPAAGAGNAACDAVEITIEGEPSHGAYPHRGRDPILALAQVVVALHAEVGRRIDPQAPAVLTVGVLEAGQAENLIPAQARARAALRAHRPADRLALREMVREVVAGVSAAHGCRGSVALV